MFTRAWLRVVPVLFLESLDVGSHARSDTELLRDVLHDRYKYRYVRLDCSKAILDRARRRWNGYTVHGCLTPCGYPPFCAQTSCCAASPLLFASMATFSTPSMCSRR